MSNLAMKIEQQRQEQYQQNPKKKQESVVVKRRATITLGEKVLILFFVFLLIIGAINIVANSFAVYHANVGIQQIESKIEEQTKLNNDLHVQVEELSTYDRIWEKAKELGLTLDHNNVKSVQN